jgi:hypothetical protein
MMLVVMLTLLDLFGFSAVQTRKSRRCCESEMIIGCAVSIERSGTARGYTNNRAADISMKAK